ncbi:MAG: hypothetical protein FD165_1551 [Gammaproteobacteria bacterium]|nr:MAG: hypothetical protein FD165_1551 [Gammaproteobacteria bacterium]TND05465.1 MAG: hypothetical protein FD120_1073 [Gammaproteobacteria bacterium]
MRLVSIAVIVVAMASYANHAVASNVKPTFLVGISGGGDDLVTTSDGDLQAGGLLYFGAGLTYEPENNPLIYRTTIGYKFNFVEFDTPSGESTLTSLPIDVLGLYRTGRTMFGAGLVYDVNPEWELCIGGCATVKFDDAVGYAFEFDYDLSDTGFFGLRYTDIDYEANGAKLDASNIRLHFGAKFN